jgi:hypothetical protein
VKYVGRDLGGMFARFDDEAGFVRALRRGRVELLELGLGAAPSVVRHTAAAVPELRWAAAAGYRPVARSANFVLLAAPGYRG